MPVETVARPAFSVAGLARKPELGGLVSAVVVFVFFAITAGDNGFLSEVGTANWLGSSAEFGIIAIPVGLLMIGGEFDLSVGAVAGLGSATLGICVFEGIPLLVGVLAAVVVGAGVGLVNGLIVTRTGLPSFIVTMSMMFIVQGGALGAARLTAKSSSITVPQPGVTDRTESTAKALLASSWHHFNIVIIWWLVLAVIASHLLFRSRYGNWIMATGGSESIANGLGVPTARVKVALFIATGVGGAFVGVIQTIEYNTADVTNGSSFIFTGIAACVIGGILLTGGYGSILGTAFGSVTYGMVSLGVGYLGWDPNLSALFVGLFLLIAVFANNYLRRQVTGSVTR